MSVFVVKRLQDNSCAGVFEDVNYAKIASIQAVEEVWGEAVCEWKDDLKRWHISNDGYVIFAVIEFPVLGGTGKITV
jgi:hypothetical protein